MRNLYTQGRYARPPCRKEGLPETLQYEESFYTLWNLDDELPW